ncbi:MAG: hypothetical protein COW30_15220 [Rhodospirillales bacterium CG15_BIG_FIL_POST_REV_8_21_14_020_66_15]|nr:MAG: hypothetical protein COW30_15220 [Rhodospirillales bacterium CG15_BIG_FIL_POST_REV_8_21_14_020_66_15]
MTDDHDSKRAERLARARAFLEAGRTQIDPAPPAPAPRAAAKPDAGPAPPDPTRFGDWEKNGRCIDF